MRRFSPLATFAVLLLSAVARAEELGGPLTPLPDRAKLVLDENWSAGTIDPARWYVPRRRWGERNHGVVPENVSIRRDVVRGKEKNVLVCEAHGDRYAGPVVGHTGRKDRVGGMIVSKAFFASGRFEVVMKMGGTDATPGGPADPRRPIGTVPAIWTYAYRRVPPPRGVPRGRREFLPDRPLYNPFVRNAYWSELDFPEFGKAGRFDKALYNAFLQDRHEPKEYDVPGAADGAYHTFATEWRTHLVELEGVTDQQVTEAEGFWWVKDKSVPFERYHANPLKRLGKDRYAVHAGNRADHWIDGKKVAENTRLVPAMAAQLTMGVWLPDWAGDAPWETSTVSFASVKVWQYADAGDVRGVLTDDVPDNFDREGRPLR